MQINIRTQNSKYAKQSWKYCRVTYTSPHASSSLCLYMDRFITDGETCCTADSSACIVFRVECGLPDPVTSDLGGFGTRGHVAVGRTSNTIDTIQ